MDKIRFFFLDLDKNRLYIYNIRKNFLESCFKIFEECDKHVFIKDIVNNKESGYECIHIDWINHIYIKMIETKNNGYEYSIHNNNDDVRLMISSSEDIVLSTMKTISLLLLNDKKEVVV